MRNALVRHVHQLAGDDVVRCGASDPEFAKHPELAGRLCILPAGHKQDPAQTDTHVAHKFAFEAAA